MCDDAPSPLPAGKTRRCRRWWRYAGLVVLAAAAVGGAAFRYADTAQRRLQRVWLERHPGWWYDPTDGTLRALSPSASTPFTDEGLAGVRWFPGRLETLVFSNGNAVFPVPFLNDPDASESAFRFTGAALAATMRRRSPRRLRLGRGVDLKSLIDDAPAWGRSLSTLDLWRCGELDDAGLAALARLPALRALSVDGVNLDHATAAGWRPPGGWPRLVRLDVDAALRFGDNEAAAVAEWPALRELSLYGAAVTERGLAALAARTELASLLLWRCEGVTDAGLAAVARMTSLSRLAVGRCPAVTGAGIRQLAALRGLTALTLDDQSIDDATLAALASLPALESLSVEGAAVTDAGLRGLGAGPALKRLNLARCSGITDEGIAALAGWPALRWVDIQDTAATPAVLARFAGRAAPLEVVIPNRWNAWNEAAEAFARQHPGHAVAFVQSGRMFP